MVEQLPRNAHILVISSETDATKCLAQFLVELGYNCTFVNSDIEAHALLKHWDFDIVLYSSEHSVLVI